MMAFMAMGEKAAELRPLIIQLFSDSHVYVLEVLRRVLYPEAHINGFEKKKKGTPPRLYGYRCSALVCLMYL